MMRDRYKVRSLIQAFHHHASSATLSLVLSAVVVGVLVGLAAVGFDLLVHTMGSFVHRVRVGLGQLAGSVVVVLIPALGGLLITPIVLRWSPEVRGSGLPAVMVAVSNLAGHIPRRVLWWRPLASTLSIGTGASLGTERPVVQLGGALASALSDLLRLNDERRQNLVAVAAAAGIAATFNAPIAGVLFALEVILGQFGNRYFASVVIGAVTASAVSDALLGSSPAFAVPDSYTLASPLELLYYAFLGVLAAGVAILFIRVLVWSEDTFNRLHLPAAFRPALGGLLVGILGFYLPVLGRGYEPTAAIIAGEAFGVWFLLALVLGKMLATGVSLASFGAGGIFAPALLIGAATGGQVGQSLNVLGAGVNSGAFALVGMAAVFAGTTRAPISTIIMVFELSHGYQLILPLLLAAVIATLVADLFHPDSVYQVILSRQGLSLLRQRAADLLQTVTVREVMSEAPRLYADDTLETFGEALTSTHHHGFLLIDRGNPESLLGIVTLQDAEAARQAGLPQDTALIAIATRQLRCALPGEAVSDVLERMGRYDIGRMPVVAEDNQQRVLGFVRQGDLARAYYQAVQRQQQDEQDEEARRLRDLTGQEIVEVRVRASSPLAGKTLREAGLPKESIVVAVRRGGRTVFPHGDTTLEPGDTVVANIVPGFGPAFRKLFQAIP